MGFPQSSPKCTFSRTHVILWMCQWHIGAGFIGEQGAKFIHTHINRLENQWRVQTKKMRWNSLKYLHCQCFKLVFWCSRNFIVPEKGWNAILCCCVTVSEVFRRRALCLNLVHCSSVLMLQSCVLVQWWFSGVASGVQKGGVFVYAHNCVFMLCHTCTQLRHIRGKVDTVQ